MHAAAAGLLVLVLAPLGAQVPEGLRPDFFQQDPKLLMVAAADKARVQREPSAQILAECGRVYLAAGLKERAEDAFQRALKEGDGDPGTLVLVAEGWLRNGHASQALAVLKNLEDTRSRAAEWLARIGMFLMEHKLPKEGEAYMDRAFKQSPKDWEMALDFGRSAVKGGQMEMATRWFQRAALLNPKDERTWLVMATALADGGK